MKVYCEEAMKFSEQTLSPFQQPRHVTVILNPVAKNRKSKDSYEKYISPILNCAGVKVSLMVTESEGQARELMEIMANTDAVIIAGGSGTIHEAVTGMFRRADGKIIPLGIIPIGKLNSSAFNVHGFSFDQLRWSSEGKAVGLVRVVADATIAVIRETVAKINVLDVESKTRNKHVYALDNINFGSIRDILKTSDKYWYLGNSMKPYLAMISKCLFRDLNSLNSPYDISIEYTEPCNGCSVCNYRYAKRNEKEDINPTENLKSSNKRWWSSFIPKSTGTKTKSNDVPQEPVVDYSNIINKNCGVWKKIEGNKYINVIVQNDSKDGSSAKLMTHSSPDHDSEAALKAKGFLITDAGRIFQGQAPQYSVQTPLSDVRLEFKSNIGGGKEEGKISIDGEEYELDDLNISVLPKKLLVYSAK